MRNHVYKAGTVLNFTHGEYSSFGNCGLLVTVRECNLPELIKQFEAARKRCEWEDAEDVDPALFPTWLVGQQYAMPVECSDIHLGGCNEYEDDLKLEE